jgi:hypothetical protein
MKLKQLVVAVSMSLVAASAVAGDFTPLPTNGTLANGRNNPNTDRLYLDATSIVFQSADIPSSVSYNAIATAGALPRPVTGSGVLTLLDHRVTLDIGIPASQGSAQMVAIGHLYDFVFRDSRDNKLVFGTRVRLGVEPDQAGDAELNFIYRYGFKEGTTTYSTAAAWLFTSDFDLRMYNAGMTSSRSLTGATPYDPTTVRMQSDVNLSEGNPFSGLFLVKTDATAYKLGTAIGVFQAGEEGQPQVGANFTGFVPTTTVPIPEPSTYAMLLGGLGLLGVMAKRRRSV